MKKNLITGSIGFIGHHLTQRMLKEGWEVVGLDNINYYYDVNLKYDRLKMMGIVKENIEYGKLIPSRVHLCYFFVKANIEDRLLMENLFCKEKFDIICNLAAQAGVRYSLENPYAYVDSNLVGFLNILECCKHNQIKHLIYASSSSVYGNTKKIPFSEKDQIDYPISLYATTKKANELMAHVYSHLYQLPTTGLRFFTVYGPWGRPDMSPMIFAEAITTEKLIKVFNGGNLKRDFTYIDDIIEVIVRLTNCIPTQKEDIPYYQLFNIGNSVPIFLIDFIHLMEKIIGKKAVIEMHPIQKGDVNITFADLNNLKKKIDYTPTINIETGINYFYNWYIDYYGKIKR